MGRRGPRPTPTAILSMRGSWRAKVRESSEPPALAGRPACPRWLEPEAKRAFRALIRQLEAMGVLSKIDGIPLARYCATLARWKRLQADVQEHGETEVSVDGRAGPRAAAVMLGRLAEQLSRAEKEFGMSAAARASLATPPTARAPGGEKSKEEERADRAKSNFFNELA